MGQCQGYCCFLEPSLSISVSVEAQILAPAWQVLSWKVINQLALLVVKLLLLVTENPSPSLSLNSCLNTKPHYKRQKGKSRKGHPGGKEVAELLTLLYDVPPVPSSSLRHPGPGLCFVNVHHQRWRAPMLPPRCHPAQGHECLTGKADTTTCGHVGYTGLSSLSMGQ